MRILQGWFGTVFSIRHRIVAPFASSFVVAWLVPLPWTPTILPVRWCEYPMVLLVSFTLSLRFSIVPSHSYRNPLFFLFHPPIERDVEPDRWIPHHRRFHHVDREDQHHVARSTDAYDRAKECAEPERIAAEKRKMTSMDALVGTWPQHAAVFAEMGALLEKKLWHELTVNVEAFYAEEDVRGQGTLLVQVYEAVLRPIEDKLQPFRLAKVRATRPNQDAPVNDEPKPAPRKTWC